MKQLFRDAALGRNWIRCPGKHIFIYNMCDLTKNGLCLPTLIIFSTFMNIIPACMKSSCKLHRSCVASKCSQCQTGTCKLTKTKRGSFGGKSMSQIKHELNIQS